MVKYNDKLTNAESFKRQRYADYRHGPVKIYTPEEIAEWELGPGVAVREKLERQASLTLEELIELDRENAQRVEREFKVILDNKEYTDGVNES